MTEKQLKYAYKDYKKLCKECQELVLLGEPATLDEWFANETLSQAVMTYTTSDEDYQKDCDKILEKYDEV